MKRAIQVFAVVFAVLLMTSPVAAKKTVALDDFEDGDIAEWSGDTSRFSASTARTSSGSHSLKADSFGYAQRYEIERSVSSEQYLSLEWSINVDNYRTNEEGGIQFKNGSTPLITMSWLESTGPGGQELVYYDGGWQSTGLTWTQDEWYTVRLTNIDYGAGTYDIELSNSSGVVGTASGTFHNTGPTNIDGMTVDAEESNYYVDEIKAEVFDGSGLQAGYLSVFNVSQPDDKLSGVDITAEFYALENDTVVRRSTTSGDISLQGVPNASRLIVRVEDGTSYHTRSVIYEPGSGDSNIYLLPKSVATVDVAFGVDDATGNFPPGETTVQLERPIELDGETQYVAVEGGELGAANRHPATLEEDQRYRIIIDNGEQTRVLGGYVASASGFQNLPIGNVEISAPGKQGWRIQADTVTNSTGSSFIRVVYADAEDNTTSISTEVVNVTNGTTIVRANTTVNDPGSAYSELVPINTTEGSYEVRYEIVRNGNSSAGTEQVGDIRTIAPSIPLDPRWGALIGMVGIVAFGGLVVIRDSALSGAIMVLAAAVFAGMGFVDINAAVIGVAGATALFFLIGARR